MEGCWLGGLTLMEHLSVSSRATDRCIKINEACLIMLYETALRYGYGCPTNIHIIHSPSFLVGTGVLLLLLLLLLCETAQSREIIIINRLANG